MIEELLEIVKEAKTHLIKQRPTRRISSTSPSPVKKVAEEKPPTPIFKKPPAPKPIIELKKPILKPLPPKAPAKELTDLIRWYQKTFATRPFYPIPLSDEIAKKVKSRYHSPPTIYRLLLPENLVKDPFYQRLNESIASRINSSSILAIENVDEALLRGAKWILADKAALTKATHLLPHIKKLHNPTRYTLFEIPLILLDPLKTLSTTEKKKALWQQLIETHG